jgi:hypothetical protein
MVGQPVGSATPQGDPRVLHGCLSWMRWTYEYGRKLAEIRMELEQERAELEAREAIRREKIAKREERRQRRRDVVRLDRLIKYLRHNRRPQVIKQVTHRVRGPAGTAMRVVGNHNGKELVQAIH